MNQPHNQSTEYQSIAPLYDLLIAPLLVSEYRQAGSLARQIKAQTVVDLCCGTGALARHMARQGMQVTGVDLSEDMLRQARHKGTAQTTFIQKNAAWTGLPTDRFDLAVISMALHEKPALLREAIIAEARRLISPAGHIILIDYTRPTTFTGRIARLFAEIIERLAGREHHTHYRSFIDAGGLDELIRQNGLVVRSKKFSHLGLIQVCLTAVCSKQYIQTDQYLSRKSLCHKKQSNGR